MARRQFLHVIFEDKDLLVIDKPAGLLSEPKADSESGDILKVAHDYLRRKYRQGSSSFVKLLHRLDKETSGVMALATSKIGMELENAFRSHQIERQYFAVVEGAVDQSEGRIDLALEKGEFSGGRKVQLATKAGEGKKAITFYRVEERYPQATVLTVRVLTGRTHQIRVHLAAIGHPVVGDKLYGAGKIPFRRQALHARLLGLVHPRTKRKMRFESRIPKDLQELVDQLRSSV